MRTPPAIDVHHVIVSMCPAVSGRAVAINVEARYLAAGVMHATFAAEVHHVVLSVFLAVRRSLATLEIVARHPFTKLM